MPDQQEPVAKRIAANVVEYVCPKCGWYDLTGVFREFLPFIDHLIQDLALKFHPALSRPIVSIKWCRLVPKTRDERIDSRITALQPGVQ
jgi:hypothetical protein